MKDDKVYLTDEGFLELEEELNELKNVKRPEVIKALKICSLGDKKKQYNCSCDECPYQLYAFNESESKGTNCDEEMMKDALEYLS